MGIEDRETAVEARETAVEAREEAQRQQMEAAHDFSEAADERDAVSDSRDVAAEKRENDADRAELLDRTVQYGTHWPERRNAGLDREHAKGDRTASHEDRAALINNDSEPNGT